ncbi:MAG: flagellar biosynthesis anti-sigma factor FlgM [Methylococcales bacterium]|nr:flagellar biosynthesis anti-sigma factor FlgM [Methylococcales bacterium]
MAIDPISTRLQSPPAEGSLRAKALQTAKPSQAEAFSSTERVTLTEQGQQLSATLSPDSTSQPPVDSDKVKQIKEALSSGTYVIDNAKIAERLQSFEQLLEP